MATAVIYEWVGKLPDGNDGRRTAKVVFPESFVKGMNLWDVIPKGTPIRCEVIGLKHPCLVIDDPIVEVYHRGGDDLIRFVDVVKDDGAKSLPDNSVWAERGLGLDDLRQAIRMYIEYGIRFYPDLWSPYVGWEIDVAPPKKSRGRNGEFMASMVSVSSSPSCVEVAAFSKRSCGMPPVILSLSREEARKLGRILMEVR